MNGVVLAWWQFTPPNGAKQSNGSLDVYKLSSLDVRHFVEIGDSRLG